MKIITSNCAIKNVTFHGVWQITFSPNSCIFKLMTYINPGHDLNWTIFYLLWKYMANIILKEKNSKTIVKCQTKRCINKMNFFLLLDFKSYFKRRDLLELMKYKWILGF